MKTKFEYVFLNMKTYINYILNDETLLYSSNYMKCLQELFNVLLNTYNKIEKLYYKYVLHPKLCSI